jgi:Ca-activated chloride channel homolog
MLMHPMEEVMKRKSIVWPLVVCAASLASYLTYSLAFPPPRASAKSITQGTLQALDAQGQPRALCPLKHTSVTGAISGGLSRVTVTQQFVNPLSEKIEAVYAFPLPQRAAVDDMTMIIGDRTVRGTIKRREEARAIYEAARDSGRVASLLDQERPDIFTQSVANIAPGAEIKIVVSYVEILGYEDGTYEFVFPMVVGPRYIPGAPADKQVEGGGWAPDTDQVPDASKITPPVTPKGTRAGHDISIDLDIDSGVPLEGITSPSHEVALTRHGPSRAVVSLKDNASIPNKDFRLKLDVAGGKVTDAVMTHRGERGGFFSLILQPPDRPQVRDITPKELVFVLDTSGSMNGFPIEKAKETMNLALKGLNPTDTFNLITFAGDTFVLFPEPVPATEQNLAKAQAFLASRSGSGGTEMMKAIRTALAPSNHQDHIRIVCFMTDGYVGNDFEIISEVKRYPNARVFSFGIGSSVNRFLLDKMAEEGRGEVEYVALNDDGSAAAKRFYERVRSPLLTDIDVDLGGLPITDVYPKRIPDLFSAKPLVITGRYSAPTKGMIRVRGKMGGIYISREVPVDLPESQPAHDVLATLWARARVDDLMSTDYARLQGGEAPIETKEAITQLGIDFRLMTQFTSFVAVEEMTIIDGGKPRRVNVPVEMPEGVSYEGTFGAASVTKRMAGGISQGVPMTLSSESVVVSASVAGGSGTSPTPRQKADEQRQIGATSKVHPAIAELIARLKSRKQTISASEAKFVRDGKAEIQIWLTEKTPQNLAVLKGLGLEVLIDSKSSKLVIGRLPIAKLAALVDLKFVRLVAPQT